MSDPISGYAFLRIIAANVDNEDLDDGQFRALIRNTIEDVAQDIGFDPEFIQYLQKYKDAKNAVEQIKEILARV